MGITATPDKRVPFLAVLPHLLTGRRGFATFPTRKRTKQVTDDRLTVFSLETQNRFSAPFSVFPSIFGE